MACAIRSTGVVSFVAWLMTLTVLAAEPTALGERRELFVDRTLIDTLSGASLQLQPPRDECVAYRFDQPWEGAFSGYCTVLYRQGRYQLYYRGKPDTQPDGAGEVTCYAESDDGRTWRRPALGLHAFAGSKDNNILLAEPSVTHNFCPFIDTRPGVPETERYKALGGTKIKNVEPGLVAFTSADGIAWRRFAPQPVITEGALDSQNVPFWSELEQRYVCYLRIFTGGTTTSKVWAPTGYRTIARMTSDDFIHWSKFVPMTFEPPQQEHLYTNQTQPYFRAPHIYLATAARFMPGRQVISADEAQALKLVGSYYKDTSDAVLLTSRGGARYDRTFGGALVRPAIGLQNWTSRTNYPALNLVPTGTTEMSLYVNQDYAQPSAHLHRYSWRLDGLASLHAPYEGGEMLTKPITFAGEQLLLNFSTSAAGGIRVEIQDEQGAPVPGYDLASAVELIGNEIERPIRWQSTSSVKSLAGRTVRLRFVMKDADVYSFRFGAAK